MDHERSVSTQPPQIDATLFQEEGGWTPEQLSMLPDGIRDSSAKHVLIEFKYSQSLSLDGILQAIGYEKFFRSTRKLKWEDVQMFLFSAITPQRKRLAEFHYYETDVPGLYRSDCIYTRHIPLLVLNQLRPEPHNSLAKIFASRKEEKVKAFASLKELQHLPGELLLMLEVLWNLWSMPEGVKMDEVLTPERVLEIGEEWKQYLLQNLPIEQLDAYTNPMYKESLFEEGRQEGHQEGQREGAIRAKQDTFIQILEHKFDEFSDVIPEMIRQVDDINELDDWINRVLDAKTLHDLWYHLPAEDEGESMTVNSTLNEEPDT